MANKMFISTPARRSALAYMSMSSCALGPGSLSNISNCVHFVDSLLQL